VPIEHIFAASLFCKHLQAFYCHRLLSTACRGARVGRQFCRSADASPATHITLPHRAAAAARLLIHLLPLALATAPLRAATAPRARLYLLFHISLLPFADHRSASALTATACHIAACCLVAARNACLDRGGTALMLRCIILSVLLFRCCCAIVTGPLFWNVGSGYVLGWSPHVGLIPLDSGAFGVGCWDHTWLHYTRRSQTRSWSRVIPCMMFYWYAGIINYCCCY